MDIRKVKKLIELLQESDIAEIEINEGEESVRISRATSQVTIAAPMAAPVAAAPSAPAAAAAAAPEEPEEVSGHQVKSPMV
ncbi:MAG: acetyl-CoA carboxylase biotin carboxyl carrier protein, partial [Rhodobacteraceae bacterium]|nr:acetyl-CoA carboxylase biotin carboxyl carrier protein [Paracoccaceae bacterium]